MNFLRNREVKLQLVLCIAITIAGITMQFLYDREFGWVLLISCFLVGAVSMIFTYRRYEKIASLNQDIDRLLHGEEQVRFDDYCEGELAVLGDEISKMTVRLLEQSDQLHKDKKYLECSLADISHQLKTPLTSLEILNAALSQENMEEEQRTRLLQEQRMLLSRMEWLIAVLLKLSRLDAGTIKFENDSFPVRELVERATEAFAITLDIRNITLDLSEVQDIQMYGDQRWLAEAISNIVKNCMESTPVGGCVKLRAEENAMYVKLTIMDNGSGIPREDIPHLFERFYRGANSAKNGVGIGLSLAKAIVDKQNGSITVENQIPHGAKFILCFYKGIA